MGGDSGEYELTMYEDLCPTKLGYPNRRSRQYVVGHRKSTVSSTGSQEKFLEIFTRDVKVSASCYFVASAAEVRVSMEKLAANRHIRYADDMTFEQLLPPGKRLCLEAHLSCLTKEGDTFQDSVFDLDKNKKCSKGASNIAPTMVTHGSFYSTVAKRCLLSKEHFLMQGLPLYSIPGVAYTCPFTNAIEKLSDISLKKLSGNGMHLAVVGTLMAYVLSTTERIAVPPAALRRGFSSDGGLGSEIWQEAPTFEAALVTGKQKFSKPSGRHAVVIAGCSDDID